MILIADSGSTKTNWRLMDGGLEVAAVKTKGLNPYYQSAADIDREIKEALLPALPDVEIPLIYFYGAGCSTPERQQQIRGALLQYFNADIMVYSDLLGAARALCGHERGIVCILGTGSGSCLFDGENIIDNIPSLGFILGDEGSGAWLGKKMVTDFLREHMPQKCIDLIGNELHINKEIILEHVNHKPMPSRYLAEFARFITQHKDMTYFYKLIFDSFTAFAENYILRYEDYDKVNCHFVGSVAYHNRDILQNVAQYNGFRIGNIFQSPIEGLTTYHATKH